MKSMLNYLLDIFNVINNNKKNPTIFSKIINRYLRVFEYIVLSSVHTFLTQYYLTVTTLFYHTTEIIS